MALLELVIKKRPGIVTIKIRINFSLKGNLSFNETRSILVMKCRTDNEHLTEASYKASYHISLQGEAHIIEKSLVKTNIERCSFMYIW